MRATLFAIAFGLAAAAGAAAPAQPYGDYPGPGAAYAYRYAPPRAYDADGGYTPYVYRNGYDYAAEDPGALLFGSQVPPVVLQTAPFDRFGPDPQGMTAVDGHVIQCRIVDVWTSAHAYVRRRQCW